jgi:hypothetical protein
MRPRLRKTFPLALTMRKRKKMTARKSAPEAVPPTG